MRDLYVKAVQNYDNEVVQNLICVIGMEATVKLIDECGGSNLYIPKSDTIMTRTRSKLILKDYNDGLTFKQISEKYAVSNKQIQSVIQYYVTGGKNDG